MFEFMKKKNKEEMLYSPVVGRKIDLSEVNDAMFSNKLLGDGVAFILSEDVIKSPCDGIVSMIAPTKHALGLISNSGTEIIIHVGLDTVNLQGEGFDVLIQNNQKVKVGCPLLKVNREFMKEKGIDLTTPMIITNGATLKMEIMDVKGDVGYQVPLIKISK